MELQSGEHVIFEGHPSWRSILAFYLKGLLFVVLGGALAAAATGVLGDGVDAAVVAAVAIGLLVVTLVVGYVKRLFTTYTITNHRLHIRRGIVARAEQQTQVTRVQNVNTHQSVLQRLLMVGDVNFDTAAGDDFDFQFAGVARPHEVVEAVHRAQREADDAATTVLPGGR